MTTGLYTVNEPFAVTVLWLFLHTLSSIWTVQIHIFLILKSTYTATVQIFNLAGAAVAGSKCNNGARCKGHKVQKLMCNLQNVTCGGPELPSVLCSLSVTLLGAGTKTVPCKVLLALYRQPSSKRNTTRFLAPPYERRTSPFLI